MNDASNGIESEIRLFADKCVCNYENKDIGNMVQKDKKKIG